MKNVKERAEFDNYELEENYDFSDGVRGRFYKSKKVPITMRIDNEIWIFLKKQASEQHIVYWLLSNALLRKHMDDTLASYLSSIIVVRIPIKKDEKK